MGGIITRTTTLKLQAWTDPRLGAVAGGGLNAVRASVAEPGAFKRVILYLRSALYLKFKKN